MVILFLLAVLGVVAAVDAVLAAAWLLSNAETLHPAQGHYTLKALPGLVPPSVYLAGALAAAGLIFFVSFAKVLRLARGGEAVAEIAGARHVARSSADPLERRLLNVVEEMAIASGVRVPQVYVMDEERAINAFAAGWDVSNATITVTRGALESLDRDELQGVIGHEFSHVVNGDMRLNVRLLGVLAGIVFLGSVGSFLMRSTRASREGGRTLAAVFAAGLGLFVVGYVGLLFARLIKAAVSRQREFLADAASVQFTRNPDGLCGALDRIRRGSALIAARCAEDMSHMFFGDSVKPGGLLATHPSLEERIRRINPKFEPASYEKRREALAAAPAPAAAGPAGGAAPNGRRAADAGIAWVRTPEASAALVGKLDAGKLDYAARLLAALPAGLREALRETEGACAAMVALLIAPKEEVMQQQLDAVGRATTLAERARSLVPCTRELGLGFHLPVIDLALATVKLAPEAAKKQLVAALEAAAYADRRVSLHEFVVLTLVRDQLAPKAKPAAAPAKRIAELAPQAAIVLALVAQAGTRADATGPREQALRAAQRAGAEVIGLDAQTVAQAPLTLDAARLALEALKDLAPMQKATLMKGLFAAVSADGTIRVGEAGVMRLVGAVLGCPLPPLLAELDPASLQA